MKNIKCIRFEDSVGIGIFHTTEFDISLELIDLCNRHFNVSLNDKRNLFPTPIMEELDICLDDKEWFCAFKNIKQVKRMFYENELRDIIKLGARIYMIEVSEYQLGRRQIIFTKESIVKKTDISELFY